MQSNSQQHIQVWKKWIRHFKVTSDNSGMTEKQKGNMHHHLQYKQIQIWQKSDKAFLS